MFSLELVMALHLICLMFYQLITNSSPNPMRISTHPSAVSLLETLFRSFLALSGCGFFWVCCQTVPPRHFFSSSGDPFPALLGGIHSSQSPTSPNLFSYAFFLVNHILLRKGLQRGVFLRFSVATNVFILTPHLNNPELDIEPWNRGNFPSES